VNKARCLHSYVTTSFLRTLLRAVKNSGGPGAAAQCSEQHDHVGLARPLASATSTHRVRFSHQREFVEREHHCQENRVSANTRTWQEKGSDLPTHTSATKPTSRARVPQCRGWGTRLPAWMSDAYGLLTPGVAVFGALRCWLALAALVSRICQALAGPTVSNFGWRAPTTSECFGRCRRRAYSSIRRS